MGVLGAVSLAIYVAGLPLVTLLWLVADPWLPAAMAAEKALAAAAIKKRAAAAGASRKDLRGGTADSVSLTPVAPHPEPSPTPNPLLAPFQSDYRPRVWVTKHLDLGATLTLAALQAWLPLPQTLALAVSKAAIIAAVLLPLAAFVAAVQPYPAQDAWKAPVRVAGAGAVMHLTLHVCQPPPPPPLGRRYASCSSC